MLEALAIGSALRTAKNAIASIPWQVWVIGALFAAIPINGCIQYREGRTEGRESVLEELRTAETKAEEKAAEAVSKANTAAQERAEVEAKVIERQIEAIENAEANDENALDSLF